MILKRRVDIKTMVFSRRHEHFTLHEAMQGFCISDCDEWLDSRSKAALNQRHSVSDTLKRQELVEEFLFWAFDGFVIPLIRVRSARLVLSILTILIPCFADYVLRYRVIRV